ncbi:SpoIID/LytB domain-containing protein [Priestia aryabhattai]|uniref:SpoIID/LytB domain-containing protein n=1 Tax=Priestia aryabhattai TaxID=412384 RepID=UPI00234F5FD4|nr:SpoIID/LytB domain-containing protein [Priestia aryabhattai]MDC7763001.1 SpoIID/LytB domain-containing protein [Priestia aryabhattai]
MKKILPVLFMLSLLITFSYGAAIKPVQAAETEPTVSVKLKNYLGNQSSIKIKPSQSYTIADSEVTLQANTEYEVKVAGSKVKLLHNQEVLGEFDSFTAKPSTYEAFLSINNRNYLGNVQFTNESSKYVRPINTIPMEDYLKGVVPKEVYTSWHADALKSQAVAARTYALSYASKIIDDTTSFQVYGGYEWYNSTSSAVDETFGKVLKYNGALINSVFSSSNGGIIESDYNAWGKASHPYFQVKTDPYDPQTKWSLTVQKQQIDLSTKDLKNPDSWWSQTKEADEKIAGKIKAQMQTATQFKGKDIKIVGISKISLYQPTSGQRMSKGDISVTYVMKGEVGQDNKLAVKTWSRTGDKADNVRFMLDGIRFKSLMITKQDPSGDTITIEGKGNGHGVGLSQFGANSMAAQGKSYTDILNFYYPGVSLVSHYEDKYPKITIPNPAQVDPIKAGDSKLSGTAEPNSTIYVKVWPDVIATGKTDAAGNFSFDVPTQQAGTMLHVLVKGQGGYSTYTKIYVQSDSAPEAAKVNELSEGDTKLTGTAEPNSTIYVKVWPDTIATGKTDNAGNFSIAIPKQPAGRQLHVLVKGQSGYSTYTKLFVQTDQAPEAAKVNAISSEDTKLTGSAEPNSTIYVKVWPDIIATGKADNAGNFSITIPKQKSGTLLHVLVKGQGGYSKYAKVTVK